MTEEKAVDQRAVWTSGESMHFGLDGRRNETETGYVRLQAIVDAAIQIAGAESCSIQFRDFAGRVFHIGPDHPSPAARSILQFSPGATTSVSVDADAPAQNTPVFGRDGQQRGTLITCFSRELLPTGPVRRLLRLLAGQAGDIIENIEKEAALRVSEMRLCVATEAARLGTYEYDPAGGGIRWDRQMRELWGFGPADVLTYDLVVSRIHPDDRDRVVSFFQEALDLRAEKQFDQEYRILWQDGSIHWMNSRGRIVREDAAGQSHLFLIGVEQDITQRKVAEAALRATNETLEQQVAERTRSLEQQDERLRAFVEQAPVAIALFDVQMSFLAGSARWVKDFGNSCPDFTGQTFADAYWKTAQAQLLAGKGNQPERQTWTSVTAARRWYQWESRPWHLATGKLGGITVSAEDVTERVKAEGALRDSETRLRASLEASPVGILSIDPRGMVLTVNPALLRLSGYSLEELVGGPIETLIPENLRMAHAAARIDYLRAPTIRPMGAKVDLQLRRKDGTAVPVEIALSPRNVFGEGLQVTAVVNDISSRLEAEAALRSSEENLRLSEQRYRELVEQVEEGIFIVDLEGRYQDANRAGCEMHGYTLDQLRTKTVSDLLVESERLRLPEQFRVLSSGFPIRSEWRFRRKDGSTFRGELVARLLPNQRYLGTVRDITDRKQLEERLRDSETRLRLAVESASIGLWDWDLRTNKVKRTVEWEKQVGWGEEELGDSFEEGQDRVHPEDLAGVIRSVQTYLAKPNDGVHITEYRLRHKDGTYRDHYSVGKLHFDSKGTPVRMLGCTLDITERKKAEEALREADRRKDEFLAILGHELRNPLAVITTALHLQTGGTSRRRSQELMEVISRQTDTLRRLVDELLDLSRITHGTIELTLEKVDLAEVLEEAGETWREGFTRRNQELVVSVPASHVWFAADKMRLEQIVTNLLSNASKYTHRGGHIALTGEVEGAEVVIRCHDNGQGISTENLRAIFEPFTRGQGSPIASGEPSLGIGLTLTRRLAELHGGTITAESPGPGLGSRFTVRLPLKEFVEDNTQIPRAAGRPTRRPLSLALIEDNPDLSQTMADALQLAGHQVTTFSEAESALAGLGNTVLDAVIVDIGLPGMDGRELAAKLRRFDNLKSAVFLAVTGRARAAEGAEAGFDGYFVKPVPIPELLQWLDQRFPGECAAATGSEAGGPLRVLLAEDNPELADVTAEMLRQEGLEVKVACSGNEALQAATRFAPELVICDWHLPDIAGKDLVRQLRNTASARDACVAILTGGRQDDIAVLQRHSASLGIDEVMSKPLEPGKLRSLVGRLMLRRHVP